MESFDAEYLKRLRAGDNEAEQRFRKYFEEFLKKRLASQNRTPHEIAATQQEILLRAWAAVRDEKTIRDPASFGAFVHKVCDHVLTKARENVAPALHGDISSDFTITFDPELSPEQIKGTLIALAEYYRQCGGVGLEVDFELEEVLASEFTYV